MWEKAPWVSFWQKVLGYEFVDSDLLIQKAEKRLLREIIADEGQDGFLKIENRVNASIENGKKQ